MESLKGNVSLYNVMFTAYRDIVNVHQLAEMLGIGVTLAYRLVRNHTIAAFKIGREYKIPKANIISYLISEKKIED